MTPAVFLFLTGVTLAFLMDSRGKGRSVARDQGMGSVQALQILNSVSDRLPDTLWVFAAGGSHWTDMFKVDILNSMGLAIALMAPPWPMSRRTTA